MPLHSGVASDDLEHHRLRVAEVEPLQRLGDDDRLLAVGREVHVVRIVHGDRLARLAGEQIDQRQAALGRVLRVVGDPERLQVPQGTTCCGLRPTWNRPTTLNVAGRSRRHRSSGRLGTSSRVSAPSHGVAELAGAGVAVQVGRVADRRHAGDGPDRAGGARRGGRHASRPGAEGKGGAARRPRRWNGGSNAKLHGHESGGGAASATSALLPRPSRSPRA